MLLSCAKTARTRRFIFRSAFQVILGLTVGWGITSCSALLDLTTDQCSKDSDCTKSFPGTKCVERICLNPSVSTTSSTGVGGSGGAAGCTTNKACADEHGQLPYICRTPGE